MDDDALGPFSCPAQACQRDRVPPDFGDSKRFYLHWSSTHKPRCPRTDCKYSLQDLSKSTESYFVRHWSTHYPNLNAGKSACGKCGHQFANANNRDRHAAKCGDDTAGANWPSTAMPGHELESELFAGLSGHIVSDLGAQERSEGVANPDYIGSLSYDIGLSPLEESASSWIWPSEPSLEQAVTFPALSLQSTDPTLDLEHEYSSCEQMLASPLQQCPFPGLTIDQSVTMHPQDAKMLSSSRKREIEDTMAHMSKRQQVYKDGVGNLSESLARTEPHSETAEPDNLMFAGALERTAIRDSNNVVESMLQQTRCVLQGISLLQKAWMHLRPPQSPLQPSHQELSNTMLFSSIATIARKPPSPTASRYAKEPSL